MHPRTPWIDCMWCQVQKCCNEYAKSDQERPLPAVIADLQVVVTSRTCSLEHLSRAATSKGATGDVMLCAMHVNRHRMQMAAPLESLSHPTVNANRHELLAWRLQHCLTFAHAHSQPQAWRAAAERLQSGMNSKICGGLGRSNNPTAGNRSADNL
jgi:hypothetical protein